MIPWGRYQDAVTWAYAGAVLVCAAVIVVRWVVGRRDRRRLAVEPRCARCDYIIRPGSSVVCPECGNGCG